MQGFSEAAVEALTRYAWPGNVRELQNLVERAVILAEGPLVNVETLGLPAGGTAGKGPAKDDAAAAETAAPFVASGLAATVSVLPGALPSLDEMEKQHILRALECTNGNRTQAANLFEDQHPYPAQQTAPVPHRGRRGGNSRRGATPGGVTLARPLLGSESHGSHSPERRGLGGRQRDRQHRRTFFPPSRGPQGV